MRYDYHDTILDCLRKHMKPALVDCSSRFDLYRVARMVRWSGGNPREVLRSIRVVRVFTIFQVKPAIEKVLRTRPDLIIIADIERVLEDEGVAEEEKAMAFERAMRVVARAGVPVLFAGGDHHGQNTAVSDTAYTERIRRVV